MLEEIKFDDKGLVPAITQDWLSGEVLMTAYMDREALEKTMASRLVHYYSRSRRKLWLKGETSGHFQHVKEIMLDCDGDALLILVEQDGCACHTGHRSCFYRSVERDRGEAGENQDVLSRLYGVIQDRRSNPCEGSYTNYLFDKGIDKMLKKVGEENAEVIIAAKNDNKTEITMEIADLMYHLSVVMVNAGVTWRDIYGELDHRSRKD